MTPVYGRIDVHKHMLRAPETYIGSPHAFTGNQYLIRDGSIVFESVTFVPGLIKLFDEIMGNAADNGLRTKVGGSDVPPISVNVDRQRVTVVNGGMAIPIEMSETENMYIPELIFGTVLTSSHYTDEESVSGGKNGYGAKATNVFSSEFVVDICDGVHHYVQRFSNNMFDVEAPTITEDTQAPYVSISYVLDFHRFEITEYSDDYIALMEHVSANYAFSCRQDVIFNDRSYGAIDAMEYINRVGVDGVRPHSYFSSEQLSISGLAYLEFAVAATETELEPISFVNGINTYVGGIHVELVLKRTLAALHTLWDSPVGNAKRHLLIVVSMSLNRPSFRSQAKDYLTGPPIRLGHIPPQVYRSLGLDAELRQYSGMSRKVEGEISLLMENKIEGLVDANRAGKRAEDCTLLIMEGPSTVMYATQYINSMPGGRNLYGVLIDHGIVPNASIEAEAIERHPSVQRLRKALGSRRHPRYHRIILMSDADPDGYHINMLKILILHRYYPEFLAAGRVNIHSSPLLRVHIGGSAPSVHLHCMTQYDDLLKEHPRASVRYMKGLGSSEEEDVRDDASRCLLTRLEVDPEMERTMRLFFSPNQCNARQEMIQRVDMNKGIIPLGHMESRTVSSYFNLEGLIYAVAHNRRTIPGMDGLKMTYRKVIWGTLCEFSKNKSPKNGSLENITRAKISHLVGLVASRVGYDFAETNMEGVIIRGASPYKNNYPLLQPLGQFGSLEAGIKGATKARYLHTAPSDILFYLFPPRDVPFLEMTRGHGVDTGEPALLLPILPISMLNGLCGIGFGFNTMMPSFNVDDIIKWLVDRMDGLVPRHCRAFIKNNPLIDIHLRPDRKRPCASDSEDDYEPEVSPVYMQSQGAWERTKVRNKNCIDIKITALPVGVLLKDYIMRLEDLKTRGIIEDFTNHSIMKVDIRVKGLMFRGFFFDKLPHTDHPKGLSDVAVKMHLRTEHVLSNLVAIGLDGLIRRYSNPCALLEDFYRWRLEYYEMRITYEQGELREKIINLDIQRRLSVLLGQVENFSNLSIEEQNVHLATHDIPRNLVDAIPFRHINGNRRAYLEREIQERRDTLATYDTIDAKWLWKEDLEQFRLVKDKPNKRVN